MLKGIEPSNFVWLSLAIIKALRNSHPQFPDVHGTQGAQVVPLGIFCSDIALENEPFIEDLPINKCDVGYVKLPKIHPNSPNIQKNYVFCALQPPTNNQWSKQQTQQDMTVVSEWRPAKLQTTILYINIEIHVDIHYILCILYINILYHSVIVYYIFV